MGLCPLLRIRLAGGRTGHPSDSLPVGMPFALPVLSQSGYMAPARRTQTTGRGSHRPHCGIRSGIANDGRRDHPIGRRTAAAGGVFIPPVCGIEEDGSAYGARYVGPPRLECRRRLPRGCRPRAARPQVVGPRDLPESDESRRRPDTSLCRAVGGNGEAGVGAFRAGAGPHRCPGEHRRRGPVCRADGECRVGGGAAVPPVGLLQMEGPRPRLQAGRPISVLTRVVGVDDRPVSGFGLQRPLESGALENLAHWQNGPPDRDEHRMTTITAFLEAQPLLALFLAIGTGYALGQVSIFGFSLGAGAVLFTGLFIGAIAPKATPPGMVGTLGLLMFLYGVGIQYGKQFFTGLKGPGLAWNPIGFFGLIASLLVALQLGAVLGLSVPLSVA